MKKKSAPLPETDPDAFHFRRATEQSAALARITAFTSFYLMVNHAFGWSFGWFYGFVVLIILGGSILLHIGSFFIALEQLRHQYSFTKYRQIHK